MSGAPTPRIGLSVAGPGATTTTAATAAAASAQPVFPQLLFPQMPLGLLGLFGMQLGTADCLCCMPQREKVARIGCDIHTPMQFIS